jgi:beta-lactamase regulating signal transducer with metallopeptidase domain
MLLPLVQDLLLDNILRHLLLSVVTGAFWLLVILFLLFAFRVKNPALKYLFLFVPLVKSVMALVRETPEVEPFKGVLMVFIQFPSFRGLLPTWPDSVFAEYNPSTAIATVPAMVMIGIAVTFFGWRLAGLIRFQLLLASAKEVSRAEHPQFFKIVDRLIDEAAVVSPKIVFVQATDTPFTVGIRKPLIALSPSLLERLDAEEIKAVLAHEIAHIARKDYLYHWPAVIVRDILFFNPITPFLYGRLSFERERACDDLGSRLSKPLALAKGLVKVAELQRTEPSIGPLRAFVPQSLLSRSESDLTGRVKKLVDPAPYAPLGGSKRLLIGLAAFFLFYVEIHLATTAFGRVLILT